jgi:hypothetical protein
MHEHLAHMIDFAESFELGLHAMVRGFVAQIEDEIPKSAAKRRPRRGKNAKNG